MNGSLRNLNSGVVDVRFVEAGHGMPHRNTIRKIDAPMRKYGISQIELSLGHRQLLFPGFLIVADQATLSNECAHLCNANKKGHLSVTFVDSC